MRTGLNASFQFSGHHLLGRLSGFFLHAPRSRYIQTNTSKTSDGFSTMIKTTFQNDAQTVNGGHHMYIPPENKVLGSVFLLDNVLLPLLRYDISSKKKRESSLRSSLHLNYAKKFASRVCKYIDCQERGVKLTLPSFEEMGIEIDDEWYGGCRDMVMESVNRVQNYVTVHGHTNQLKILVFEWNKILSGVLESELKQKAKNSLPMGEVDFWRRRHIFLSDIMEQLNNPKIQIILTIAENLSLPLHSELKENINSTTKLALEAADNSKFLSTLERHLRTIQDGSLSSMVIALPSLVDGLRMVSIVSRFYCRQDIILPFMKKIASQLATRVKYFVHLENTTKYDKVSIACFKKTVEQSKRLLESWKTAYLQARDSMKKSEPKQRTRQFDLNFLFHETDYMANICGDLGVVIDSLHEFYHFLGPELLALTGYNEHINQVVNVVCSFARKISNFRYDIFDIDNAEEWQETCIQFQNEVARIKRQTEMAVETTFQQLRSSEQSHEFVLKLNTLHGNTLSILGNAEFDRHKDILDRYCIELQEALRCYEKRKLSPPLCWRYHQYSGRISVVNEIYRRIKSPIVVFRSQGSMLNSTHGKKIMQSYINFARNLDSFKSSTYNEWSLKVGNMCHDVLHCSVLRKDETKKIDKSKYLLDINFPSDLRLLMSEGKRFLSFGYAVPENLLHFILQQPIYDGYTCELEKLSYLYNRLQCELTTFQEMELKQQLTKIEVALLPLLTFVHWSSQCVLTHVSNVINELDAVYSILHDTTKFSSQINRLLTSVANNSLVCSKTGCSRYKDVVQMLKTCHKEIEEKHSMMISLNLDTEKESPSSQSDDENITSTSNNYWGERMNNAFFELVFRSFLMTFFYNAIDVHNFEKAENFEFDHIYEHILQTLLDVLRCTEVLTESDTNYNTVADLFRHPTVISMIRLITTQCLRLKRFNDSLEDQ